MTGGGSQRFVLVEILLVSCTVLFLELALIRWLPANIYSLAFFSNLVLLAAFYGFGLGNLCGTLRFDMMRVWPFYVCGFVAAVLLLRDLEVLIPERSAEWIWSRYRGDQISSGNFEVPIEIVLIALFFAVAAVFVPLGQRLARLMVRVESLSFYNFDLLGSLIGIALFAVMSAAATRPHVWFALAAILVLPALVGGNRQRSILLALPLVAVIALAWHTSKGEIWSPYYSILTRPSASGIQVFVNRLYHQEAINLAHSEIPGYLIPYRFFSGGDVLVVGAGTGNDVAVALLHGASRVDAVEIDPAILQLGDLHPMRPYDDPRVRPIVQDARTFLQNTGDRYDLIVFGTLDSHALLSSVSNVRIDNYVYTLESLEAARRCLRENGRLAMLYSVPVEDGKTWSWIRDRLVGMAVETFGEGRVLAFVLPSSYLNLVVVASAGDEFGSEWTSVQARPAGPGTILPTDDWPFLYLEDRIVPWYHVVVIAATLILGLLPIVLLLPRGHRRPHWNFFLLGGGFLLLETSAITRISLLFGSTWVINSIVFFSILLMVLVANLLVQSGRGVSPTLAYCGIFAALLLTYLVDIRWFLYSSATVKVVVAVFVSGLPILFAGFVFSQLFRRTADVQHAFGSNLLGAFFGGFCEYLGMVVGLNNMLMLALVGYLISFLIYRQRPLSA